MFKRIQICGITALLLLPAWLSAQQTCEPNYSSPYTVINNVMVTGSMSNNHYSTFMTVGQAFIDTSPNYSATNYSVNSNATGFWSTYLKEPRPPLVWASDGDFQDMVLVEWQVEDDRTGPPVSGEMVTLYRNGYVLTQLPVAQTQYQDFNVFAGEYYDYGVTSSNDMGTSYTQDDIGFLNPNGVITGHVETRGGNPMLDTKVLLTPNLGRSAMFDGQSYIYFFDQNTSANKQFSGLMGDYTIETWFRSIVSEQQTIFAAVDSATANHYVLLELTDQGQVHWMHNPVAGLVDAELTTVNGFTDDSAWHHIAAVFEDNHMTLYVDAAIVGETTASGPVLDSAEIMIGKLDPTNTLDYYDGRLDDFRIWNLARSWADLRKYIDITLSGEEWGLAAYWKFDEVEGETIFDLTENDIDGTICGVDHNNFTAPVFVGALSDSTGNYVIRGIYFGGGTTFTATPSKTTPIGRSLEFDGIDDHVSFTGQRIDLTGEYTLEGWFKTPSQFQQTLFAGVDPDGGATHLAVEMNPAGFIEVDYGTGIIVSNAAYNDNLWHHFAVSSDGAELILYVDAADISGPVMPGDIDVLTELVLARQAPEVSGNYFGGYLDEFRLWDYMRSDVQIAGGMYLPQEDDSYGLASYWRMNEGSCDLIADATGNLVTGTIQEALWSMDIPLSEVFHHIYEPESRQATLNHSNTSVDMVDFTDISLIAISGFVRYVDTACFQGGVEMLLNGEPFLLPNFTDEDGKYIVEIEPGSTGDILSCRYADHAFIPPFIELPMISVPITALYFNDTMVHDAGGIVAGGECQYPITPALGSIAVTMTAVNGCIERTVVPSESTGMWEMTDMPPLIYQVTVDHPDPAIDSFFTGDTLQITEGDGEENFIYTAPPEISLTGFPTDDCGLRVMKQYNQDDPQSGPYELTANMFETYINHIGPDTNTCPIDTGMVQIISNLGDATRDTTVAFSGGELTFLMGAGQPNILSGGDHPYQKSIQAVMSDSTGAPLGSTTEWTYVVGRRPRETGFATTTPEIPFMIIHQPPGDGSSAYWSAGTSFSQSMQFSLATSAALNTWVVAHLGPDFESTQGSPFFSVGTEIDTQLDIGLDIGVEVSSEIADEQVWTWSTTETVTTAGEGDVYMGGALNLLYGMTDVVYIDESCTASDSATILITPEGFATNYFYSESHILDQVIPNLYLIGEDESAELWQDYVDLNHANMEAAAYEKNISFDAGVEYAYEDVYESENSLTYSMGLDIVTEIAIEAGVEINGLGVTSGMRVTLGVSIGAGGSSTWVNTTTTGYTLADEDSGDSFTIDVKSDPVYATPVFETISGFSSCPWEENTVPRDGPSLGVAPMMQINVPPDEFAVFDLLIGNVSQTDEDREYAISVVQSSNPDGAVVAVNGVIIEDALYFDVPAGETIMSTMTIGRGPVEYNYNGLEIRLFSPCDPDLSESVLVNIEYQVPCSESHIAVPENGWLVAGDYGSDSLWVTIDGYDRYDPNLDRIELQYRQSVGVRSGGGDTGIPDDHFLSVDDDLISRSPSLPAKGGRKDALSIKSAVEDGLTPDPDDGNQDPAPRVGDWFITATIAADDLVADYVLLPFNVSPSIVIDGEYELKAVAVCNAGLAPGTSPVVSGLIDRAAPELLGAPTPVDGILEPEDEISIHYNEDIECGEISVGAQHIMLFNTVTGNPVDFTYTCGGNTIVIVPNIQNHFIENQTLRASVGPVQDMYGNQTVEPTMWEFFVNRNPLTWIGPAIDNIIIWIGDTYTTTRTVMNVGSSNRSYDITNIPPWLTVFPTSGILPPGGAETITFLMSEEPGAGQYDQIVYASGTMGDEPMPVDIRVLCHPPDWEFSPETFEFSMNIIAHLLVEGELSEDVFDVVAVFVDDELRGVQNVQYVPEIDFPAPDGGPPLIHPYEVYITVFSNTISGEDLSIQVWDASECTLLGQTIEEFAFQANTVLGSPALPTTISATNQVIRYINLVQGWTWFSLNVTPPDMTINSILESLSPANNDQIKGHMSYSQYAESYGWLGTLTELNNDATYMIKLADPGTLEVTGYPVNYEVNTIPVEQGWNWISYLPQLSYDVNDALGSLISFSGDLIKSQFTFSMYMEGAGWLGNLNFMTPQSGYMLHSSLEGILAYPLPGEILSRDGDIPELPLLTQENSQDWLVNTAAYSDNMSVVAILDSEDIPLDDPDMILGAFSGDHCIGVARPIFIPYLTEYQFFLTVFGDHSVDEVSLRLYSSELDKLYEISESTVFGANGIIGSPEIPLTLTAIELDSEFMLIPEIYGLDQNYPNPFNPNTTIDYALPEDSAVHLAVYNINGQKITTLVSEVQTAGYKQISWNGTDANGTPVPTGIYIYRLKAGDYQAQRKLALVK